MGTEHTHNHCTPMQPLPNVGVLRYLKDPVGTINELYADTQTAENTVGLRYAQTLISLQYGIQRQKRGRTAG